MTRIRAAIARGVLDSRGKPTIEVEIAIDTATVRAIAPAGASTGRFEARERRDADGFGVRDACAVFQNEVAPGLIGRDPCDQASIDAWLRALDGTADLRRLGGNTAIATSMAVAHAGAAARGVPLWRHVAGDAATDPRLPMPEIQIFGGGAHAHGRLDLQDFMVVPIGAPDWRAALDWSAQIYRAAGQLLAEQGRLHGVADEGGHFPAFDGNEAALGLLVESIERAGRRAGEDVAISIDVAASQLYRDGCYRLPADGIELARAEWVERLADWIHRYPIALIEDPCAEDDVESWRAFRSLAPPCKVVGDDLVVTDAARIRAAARDDLIDAALIKPNQAGTVSDAADAFGACLATGRTPIVSARSGETEDVTIVHLAVGWRAPMIKVGSIARGERTAKWNEGLRISEQLGDPPLANPKWLSKQRTR